MADWRRMFIRAAGFGAGFALALISVAGTWLWYSNRPKPPRPWDGHAITAEYDYVTTKGDNNNIAVYYTLQNNTDFDYEIRSLDQVQLAAKLERENSISVERSEEGFLTADFPVFVPARGRSRCGIHLRFPYPEKSDNKAPDNEQHDYGTRLAKFMTSEFSNLDGFVFLDSGRRYRVELPSGWKTRSKEALRAKTNGTKSP
jgi:hypothetical protein